MAKTKLEREKDSLLDDLRVMLRNQLREAVSAGDLKEVAAIIKFALVGKDWLWIYAADGNPWAADSAASKIINVRIYGEEDLV